MKNVKSETGGIQMLLNVFAHDIKLALAEYKVDSKEGESTVLKEALQGLFTRYPGLTILVGDTAFSGRELNHAIIALGKDYVVQVKKINHLCKSRSKNGLERKMSKILKL